MKTMTFILMSVLLLSLSACTDQADDTMREIIETLSVIEAGEEPKSIEPRLNEFDVHINASDPERFKHGEGFVRPSYYEGDETVTLEITLENDDTFREETIQLTVPKNEPLKHTNTLEFYNVSQYTINPNPLDVHYNEPYAIPYVSVKDFIDLLDSESEYRGVINKHLIDISTDDARKTLTLIDHEEAKQSVSMALTFNAADNTITLSDYGMLNAFHFSPSLPYANEVELYNYTKDSGEPITFYLNDYQMEIINHEGHVFVPLHVLNLMLSGESFNVHYTHDALYGYDAYGEGANVLHDFNFSEHYNSHDANDILMQYHYDFTVFLFDHFYGLKDYQQIDSYYSELNASDFTDFDDAHDKRMQDVFSSLNDPHTTYLNSSMFTRDKLPSISEDNDSTNVSTIETTLDDLNEMGLCSSVPTTHDYESMRIIELPDFKETTIQDFETALHDVDEDTDIVVIDVSCNTGGMLTNMVKAYSHIHDGHIDIHQFNTLAQTRETLTYQASTSLDHDVEWVLRTSNATYSAGNLMAELVRQNGAATLIGERSAGGANSVKQVSLPSGGVVALSSPIMLTDEKGQTIEDGIAPDIAFNRQDFNDLGKLYDTLLNKLS